MTTVPKGQELPPSRSFHVTNWFQWCIDARDAGYSQNDMRWILKTVGVLDELRRAVEADNARRGIES